MLPKGSFARRLKETFLVGLFLVKKFRDQSVH